MKKGPFMRSPDVVCMCGHRKSNHAPDCFWDHCDCAGYKPPVLEPRPWVFRGPKAVERPDAHVRREKRL